MSKEIDCILETGNHLRRDFHRNLRHSRRLTRRQLRVGGGRRHRWTPFWQLHRQYHRSALVGAQTHSRLEVLESGTMHLVKTITAIIFDVGCDGDGNDM